MFWGFSFGGGRVAGGACAGVPIFNKVVGLRPVTLLIGRLWHGCFPVGFVGFLGAPFLQSTFRRLLLLIPDHLPQFIILPKIFSNPPSNKSNIYERDWSNFVQENFILDYFFVDWNSLINNDKDVNLSFNNFLRESMLF